MMCRMTETHSRDFYSEQEVHNKLWLLRYDLERVCHSETRDAIQQRISFWEMRLIALKPKKCSLCGQEKKSCPTT